MESAHSDLDTNNALNCYCSYIYKGHKLILQELGPQTLFNYMNEDFQKDLKNLLNARTSTDFLQKYMAFFEAYGFGCVTELYLTSGSAFKMKAKYSGSNSANKAKYGGSIGVHIPLAGASVASDFAKEVMKSDSCATLEMYAEQLPSDTPTKAWCEQISNSILSAGLAKLAQQPDLIKAYTENAPKAPVIPAGEPSKKKLPEGETPSITEELQKELMKQDHYTGTWKSYLEEQKKAYENLKPDQIVAEACENRQRLLEMKPDVYETGVIPQPLQADLSGEGWDLGGYIPYDYKITPWTKLFPQLKGMAFPMTFSSIYIAKAYVYYLTRLKFASYLNFLADVGKEFCLNSNIKLDADNYARACKQLLDGISRTLSGGNGTFRSGDYENMVAGFEQTIQNMRNFYSKDSYKCFFDHYRFFIDNACGLICVCISETGSYYIAGPYDRRAPLPKPFSVIGMMQYGMKHCQALTPDGNLNSIVFLRDKFIPAIAIVDGLDAEPRTDENGFTYYRARKNQKEGVAEAGSDIEYRLYSAGFPELEDLGEKVC